MKNVAFLLVLLALCFNGWGCAAPSAPRYYSIDDAFSPEEVAVIEDAVSAWCDVGVCLERALDSENARFTLVDDLPEGKRVAQVCPEGRTCVVNGKEGRGIIRIARNRANAEDMASLWRTAAHELGHLCIEGHVATSSLMSEVQDHEAALEVDEEAVEAWHAGCS